MASNKSGEKAVKFVSVFLLAILVISCILLLFSDYLKVKKYENVVYPNTYLGDYKLSDIGFIYLDKRIEFYTDSILNTNVTLVAHGKEYNYTFRELNLELDTEAIIDDIKSAQDEVSYSDKLSRVKGKEKKIHKYKLKYSRVFLSRIITEIKKEVDVNVVYDGLVMSPERVLTYNPGVEGFILDVEKSVNEVVAAIEHQATGDLKIDLVGEKTEASKNKQFSVIDTKVSSFSTEFDPYIRRATNLRTGLAYVDGAIIMPGEVFSFYNYAGPYNKSGYVFYYEFVGNGVCQIATTVYNAALLGGLEIVKRYPHKAKSVYVPGGLDATVASYANGWHVDMAFRNTYDYPIYISAYSIGGTAYVDFWSNHDAKRGKTYSTSSEQIGVRGYDSFLHVYENGVEVEKRKIARTWYSE